MCQVGGEKGVFRLAPVAYLAAQGDLLCLVLEGAGLELGLGILTGLDLLGVVDFLLRREELVLADGCQILADQVRRQASALVGELAPVAIATRASQRVALDALLRFLDRKSVVRERVFVGV